MSNISSIRLSGTTYSIKDASATTVVSLTQAQYDALVTKDPNTLYNITDAQGADLSQYYTSAQTESAITAAVSGKVDTSTFNTYSGSVDTALSGKQDTLTAGTGIDITDNVISATGGGGGVNVVQTTGTSTADVMSQDAVTTQLGSFVTVSGNQTISGRKVFTFSSSSSKAIEFKQTDDTSKLGFTIKNSASTNNELASFEFRPNTFTIDGVQHPLLYFGHYRNTNTANAGIPQTVIGYRQYDQKNNAAYHYLMPLPEKAKIPFSLTTSFKDYYAPIGFKNGSTMITANDTGVVDLSSELGGLKLVKLTQSEYDALTTKDNSTLYVIVN